MPRVKKSSSAIIDQLESSVRADIAASLQPAVQRIADAVAALQSALGGGKRRGRKPGPKPAGSPGVAAGPGRKGRKRGRRGALKESVLSILASGKAMKIAEIRDAALAQAEFKGRNPKSIYTQVVGILGALGAKKTADGAYHLKGKQ